MNRSKLKLTTIIALTAFTVAVIPACLQRKSANAASKYTYKKALLMRRFLRTLKRGSRENLIVRIIILNCLI